VTRQRLHSRTLLPLLVSFFDVFCRRCTLIPLLGTPVTPSTAAVDLSLAAAEGTANRLSRPTAPQAIGAGGSRPSSAGRSCGAASPLYCIVRSELQGRVRPATVGASFVPQFVSNSENGATERPSRRCYPLTSFRLFG
jgi:hypothetical protein